MTRINKRLAIAMLHTIAIVLLLLVVYVRTLPPTATIIPEEGSAEANWWGLWPVTYLPLWIFLCGAGLLLVVMATIWYRERRGARHISTQQNNQQWIYYILMSTFVAAFYLFPIAHTRWGDAYILAKAIAHPDPAIQLTHSWQAPLDLLLHSQIWQRWHESMGWQDAMPVYRLLSPVAGILYLSAVMGVSVESRWAIGTPKWLTFGLLTSLGAMQLFFGYVENYSFAAAGILIYLWLGLLTCQEKCPLWIAALALAITNALHPSTIVYWPSMFFLSWQMTDRRNMSWLANVYKAILPTMVVAAGVAVAVVAIMEWGDHGLATLLTTDRPGGGDARWLVPLWATTTRWEHYTMFSWPHLRDVINTQLLVAPILFPVLCTALAYRQLCRCQADTPAGAATAQARSTVQQVGRIREQGNVQGRYITFLAIAAFCHLFLTWVWNPDYGGQRDWDLFSLALLPTALLAAQLLPTVIRDQHTLRAGMIPLLMLQYAQLATWVYQNTLPWEWP